MVSGGTPGSAGRWWRRVALLARGLDCLPPVTDVRVAGVGQLVLLARAIQAAVRQASASAV